MKEKFLNLVRGAAQSGASDIHLLAGRIYWRWHGALYFQEAASYAKDIVDEFAATPEYASKLKESGAVDFAVRVADVRLRANLYQTMNGLGLALRILPDKLPTPDELGLGDIFNRLANLSSGLILATGRTGSGKSTTLAALLNGLLKIKPRHLITLEDPIEYVFTDDRSLVSQREIGRHFSNFADALAAALREMPDIILVGEIRDAATLSAALRAAESGSLVFSSLHTPTAAGAVERVAGFFPPSEKAAVLGELAASLEIVIAQSLYPRKDGGGRIAAFEIMTATPAVRNLIRQNQTAQLDSAILAGKNDGMVTMKNSLDALVRQNVIAREVR